MISTVLPLGSETVGWQAKSDSRFARFVGPIVCGLLGRDPGTVVAHGVWVMPQDTTTAHPPLALPREGTSVGAEIFEIRRLSGLTWDQLATVFGVTRRSLHHWVNGKPLSAANEDRVRRVLATLQQIDRGEARRNHALLMTSFPGGGLVIDLLQRGDFDALEHFVQAGPGRTLPDSLLSGEAVAARRPLSPAVLVDARDDDGPVNRGRFMYVERARPRRRTDQG